MTYKVGDVIQFKNAKSVRRMITRVSNKGYEYKAYDEILGEYYCNSWDSADPFLEDGWHKV